MSYNKEYAAAYYQANKDRIKARGRPSGSARKYDRERNKIKCKEWAAKNPERKKELHRVWKLNNKGRNAQIQRRAQYRYRLRHMDELNERARKRRVENPEAQRAYGRLSMRRKSEQKRTNAILGALQTGFIK